MPNPKRHHTIPRVYLEAFTDDDGRLTIYSKRQKNKLRQLPKKALIRKNYYSQPTENEDEVNLAFEVDTLGKIENAFPALRSALLSGELDIEPQKIIDLVGSLRVRSPSFREPFELGLADLVVDTANALPLPPLPRDLPDWFDPRKHIQATIDPHRSIHAMVHYIKTYGSVIGEFEYSVREAPKNREFLCSDSPVIWFDWEPGEKLPIIFPFRICQRTRLVVPLSKKVALWGRPSRSGDFKFTGRAGMLSDRNVSRVNFLQVACSWDQIVGKARVPKALWEKASILAPHFSVTHFDPDTNKYILESIDLRHLRKKVNWGASYRKA